MFSKLGSENGGRPLRSGLKYLILVVLTDGIFKFLPSFLSQKRFFKTFLLRSSSTGTQFLHRRWHHKNRWYCLCWRFLVCLAILDLFLSSKAAWKCLFSGCWCFCYLSLVLDGSLLQHPVFSAFALHFLFLDALLPAFRLRSCSRLTLILK